MTLVPDISGSIDIHSGNMKQYLQSDRRIKAPLALRRGSSSIVYRRHDPPGTVMRHFLYWRPLTLHVLTLPNSVREPTVEGALILAPRPMKTLSPSTFGTDG